MLLLERLLASYLSRSKGGVKEASVSGRQFIKGAKIVGWTFIIKSQVLGTVLLFYICGCFMYIFKTLEHHTFLNNSKLLFH